MRELTYELHQYNNARSPRRQGHEAQTDLPKTTDSSRIMSSSLSSSALRTSIPVTADSLEAGPDDAIAKLNSRTVRKLDFILLPYLSLLFLLNALDRSNIGNAETANFTRDSGLEPSDLNTAVACFFAFFVALQPVGAAVGRRYGMATYVPTVMASWGACTALHVGITQKWELISIRIIIGILEAGFYPTTVSYLSLFYTRYEFARRLGFFYGQYALAGALGGLLSYAVFSLFPQDSPGVSTTATEHDGGWKSWQVLFLVEGSLTIAVALVGFFWLPREASNAWFLTRDERIWAKLRIFHDRRSAEISKLPNSSKRASEEANPQRESLDEDDNEAEGLLTGEDTDNLPNRPQQSLNEAMTSDRGLSRLDIIEAISDWKIWYLLVVNICSSVPAVAFTVFLPMVVKGLGFNSVRANLLTAPPFLTGFIILWIFMWWSDRRQQRISLIIYGLLINLAGLTAVVMLPTRAYVLRYLALCVLLGGSFVASPLTVAWLSGNIEEPGKRSIVLGINGWGNLAGVFSALLFSPRYAPDYQTPFYITLCLVLFSLVGYAGFGWLLLRENRFRRRLTRTWSSEDVEKERRWGLGPGPGEGYSARLRRMFLAGSSRRSIEVPPRRGDEKMTFTYSL